MKSGRLMLAAATVWVMLAPAPAFSQEGIAALALKNGATGCLRGDCENGEGVLVEKTEQGRIVYRGAFEEGLYHGFGRLIEVDKNAGYEGYWKEGKRDGRGTQWEETPQGYNVYIGQWSNGRRNGQGVQAFKLREWNETLHTETWLKENAENYAGNFQNDVFYGYGAYRWTDGTKYVGEWAANKKHGPGYFDYGNGQIAPRRYEFDQRVFNL